MVKSSKAFASTRREMEAQAEDIPAFISYFNSLGIKENAENSIFSGSGDSLACSMFVERLTGLKARALDPYDLILFPEIACKRNAYFVSVSGKTSATIDAARAAKLTHAGKTCAITHQLNSPLARNCDSKIELRFTKTNEPTPGTNSFTISLLACSLLYEKVTKFDVEGIIESAKTWAKETAKDLRGTPYFVGSGEFYPLALYGSAKLFEFARSKAAYQLTEQFSHLNLFSIDKKKDSVVILRKDLEEKKATDLDANLSQAGVQSYLVPIHRRKSNVVELAISYAIHLQYLALEVALNKGYEKPAFFLDKEILNLSNRMIY